MAHLGLLLDQLAQKPQGVFRGPWAGCGAFCGGQVFKGEGEGGGGGGSGIEWIACARPHTHACALHAEAPLHQPLCRTQIMMGRPPQTTKNPLTLLPLPAPQAGGGRCGLGRAAGSGPPPPPPPAGPPPQSSPLPPLRPGPLHAREQDEEEVLRGWAWRAIVATSTGDLQAPAPFLLHVAPGPAPPGCTSELVGRQSWHSCGRQLTTFAVTVTP